MPKTTLLCKKKGVFHAVSKPHILQSYFHPLCFASLWLLRLDKLLHEYLKELHAKSVVLPCSICMWKTTTFCVRPVYLHTVQWYLFPSVVLTSICVAFLSFISMLPDICLSSLLEMSIILSFVPIWTFLTWFNTAHFL